MKLFEILKQQHLFLVTNKQIFWDFFIYHGLFFKDYYSISSQAVNWPVVQGGGKIFKAGPHIVFPGQNSSGSSLQSLPTRLFSLIFRSPTLRTCVEADMKFFEISWKLSLLPSRNNEGGINIFNRDMCVLRGRRVIFMVC